MNYLYPLLDTYRGVHKYDTNIHKVLNLDIELENIWGFSEYILGQYLTYITIREKIVPKLYTKENNTVAKMQEDVLKKIDCKTFQTFRECSNFQSIITNIEQHSFTLPERMSHYIAKEIEKEKGNTQIIVEKLSSAFAYIALNRNRLTKTMARQERAKARKLRAQFLFGQPPEINELNNLINIYPDFQK